MSPATFAETPVVIRTIVATWRGIAGALYAVAWLALFLASATASNAAPPTAPSSLTATSMSQQRINLSWTAATDDQAVSTYSVERCQGTGCSDFVVVVTAGASITSYSNTGLQAQTSYSYRVRARDVEGNFGPYSNVASAATLAVDTTPPTAPTGLTVTLAKADSIQLSWTASADNVGVTQYLLERCQGEGCSNFAQVGTRTTTSHVDAGLSEGTSYSYRVRATDDGGNLSEYSNVVSATTGYPPTAPGNLTATAVSGGRIDMSWTPATDDEAVGSYYVERCQGAGCANFVQIYTTNVGATSYSSTGLQAETSYSYRVRAGDFQGNRGPYSNVATATTLTADTTPPTAPTGLTVTSTRATYIFLSWTAATDNVGISQYLVERCQGEGCANFVQVATATTTSHTNSNLSEGTSYSYRVRAKDDGGNLSEYSNMVSATTGYAPTAPGSLTATAVNDGRIDLSWTAATDDEAVTQYYVERCQGIGCSNFSIIAGPSASVTSYSNTGLQAQTSYTYRVKALDNQLSFGPYSNVASATTLGPTQAQIYFIHADHLNTPRLVADAAGTTVWRWDQAEPFGNNPADENPSGLGVFDLPLRLPGQRYDAETGLHYNYFRDYDPSLGRYSQSDPVGLMFGPNTYLYGLANPLSNTDFTGLFSSDSFGIAEGGGFGIGGALTVHKQSGIGVGGSAGLEIRSCCGPDNLVYTEYLLVANLGPSWGQSRRLSPTGNINAVRVGPMPKCVSETKFEAGLLSVNVQVFGAVVGTDLQTLTGTIGITAGSGASLVVNMLSGTRPLWKTPTGERCDCNKAE